MVRLQEQLREVNKDAGSAKGSCAEHAGQLGEACVPGKQSEQDNQGKRGRQSNQGEQGKRGSQGKQGNQGKRGKQDAAAPSSPSQRKPCKKAKKAVGYRHLVHEFEPVFNEQSRILILGSFPSVASRENNFYYGHAHNRFWQVIAACTGRALPQTVEEKKDLLLANGVALWDVIQECDIKGSSDASIKNVTPTAIERIMNAANIQAVFCNGATAARLYKKYLLYKTGIEAVTLPSTSPANAAWDANRLIVRWSLAFNEAKRVEYALMSLDGEGKGAAGSREGLPTEGAQAGGCEDAEAAQAVARAVRLARERRKAKQRSDAPPATTYAVHRSMQGNKRADTKPELLMREHLREAGLGGYRLQWKVPGRPDIAWPGKKVALFISGCFWHRCPHCKPLAPKTNVEYWEKKFKRNVERDAQTLAALHSMGWKTHVVWECQLKKNVINATLAELFPVLAQELGKKCLAAEGDSPADGSPSAEGDLPAEGNSPDKNYQFIKVEGSED